MGYREPKDSRFFIPNHPFPITYHPRLLLQPAEDIEIGRHERRNNGQGSQKMPDQDDRQHYDKPAPDGALDEILLLGRLSGKRKTVHEELKYRELRALSTTGGSSLAGSRCLFTAETLLRLVGGGATGTWQRLQERATRGLILRFLFFLNILSTPILLR